MLRRLLPSLHRGIVSSAVPDAKLTLLPRWHHRASAPHSGASIFKPPHAVLPGSPRCPSCTVTRSSGFTAMSLRPESPVIISTREDTDVNKQFEEIGLIQPKGGKEYWSNNMRIPRSLPVRPGGKEYWSNNMRIPRSLPVRPTPEASRTWMSSYKRCFSSTTSDAVSSSGPALAMPHLAAEIDWSRYVHVKKFDCSGQELCTDAIPLKPYVDNNPMIEVRKLYGNRLSLTYPDGSPVKDKDSFEKDIARKYCKQLIDGMSEFHRAKVCVESLDHTNIVIAAGGLVAKYTDVTFIPATLEMKKKNYAWLKRVLKEDLFQGKVVSYDMGRLLFIMETHPVASEYLMKRYIALVPQVNKSAFYLRLYERFKILMFIDPEVGRKILSVLLHHTDKWRHLMSLNDILHAILTHGQGYDPKDDTYIFMLCYKHSCYHKCDRCCHQATRVQLYTAEMCEDVLESMFGGYIGKLEEELYIIGQLHLAQVDHLL